MLVFAMEATLSEHTQAKRPLVFSNAALPIPSFSAWAHVRDRGDDDDFFNVSIPNKEAIDSMSA